MTLTMCRNPNSNFSIVCTWIVSNAMQGEEENIIDCWKGECHLLHLILWEMSWRVDKLLGKEEEMLELGCKNFGNMRLRPFWHGCTDVTQPTAASMLDAVQGQSETLQHTQKSGRFSHSFSWTTKQLQSKVGSRKNCVSNPVHPLEGQDITILL